MCAEPDTADVERSALAIQEVARTRTLRRVHSHLESKDEKSSTTAEVIEAAPQDNEDTYAQPGLRSILVPRVLLVILNFGFLAFTDQAIVVLVPLMYSTSIPTGGLGMDSFTIGVIQGVAGFMGGVLQIVTLPWMERRFGTKRLYTASYACFIVVFATFPLMAYLARRSGGVGVGTWVVIVVQFVAYALASMTWGRSLHRMYGTDVRQLMVILHRVHLHLHHRRGAERACARGHQRTGANYRVHRVRGRAFCGIFAIRGVARRQHRGRDICLLGVLRRGRAGHCVDTVVTCTTTIGII